jgi:geranylgeranyl pyrophosphate synthase
VAFEPFLARCQRETEARLDAMLPVPTGPRAVLVEAMRYSALSGGKRLRPALCLASAMAVGGETEAVWAGACAVELVHCFSLVHDDLPAIDDDALRRGRPTTHVVYGDALAVLAGDALFALAFECLAGCHAPAEARAAALDTLARASGTQGLVGGEVMDVLGEGQAPELGLVEEIHRRKTGALISASCVIGGILGGGSDFDRLVLAEFGDAVGLAFQIVDDVLNETSTPEALGKAAGSDAARLKQTFPAAVGLEASNRAARSTATQAMAALNRLPGDTRLLAELVQACVERDS